MVEAESTKGGGMSARYPANENDCFNYGINGMCGPECPAYGETGRDCEDEAAYAFETEEIDD
jgi:hypothetical protein